MCFSLLLGFLGLVTLAGGAFLALIAWRSYQYASVCNSPLSRIAKLMPGFRKVRGTVAPLSEPLVSPLSNKPCVYYRFNVIEYRTTYHNPNVFGEPSDSWLGALFSRRASLMSDALYGSTQGAKELRSTHTLVDETDSVLLVLEDDTGWVEADLRGASVSTKEKSRFISNIHNMAPAKLSDMLLEEYGIDALDDRGNPKYSQFIEEMIPVGAQFTIAGPVEPLKSGTLRFRQKSGTMVVSDGNLAKQGQKVNTQVYRYLAGASLSLTLGLSGPFHK
jgi:hypothetical protein